jgi:hypothetical protein
MLGDVIAMTFPIHQLDKLDYDDAEPLLDDYIQSALEDFAESKTGKAHIKQYPEGGGWIGIFIEMAYIYGGYTLPKMTKGNVQEVMEYILPRKLTLLDPSETDDAIDELAAFWTYLGETYGLRSAKAIVKYLRSIENEFPQWMFASERGGIAKNFIMQGMEAGFDMTTQEGVEAFQQQYNQNLPSRPPMPGMPMSTIATMTTPPPDMKAAFERLGLELPKEGEQVDLLALMQQFMQAVEQLDPAMAEELMDVLDTELDELDAELEDDDDDDVAVIPGPGDALNDIRVSLMREKLGDELEISDEEKDLLRQQTITATEPGTILQDFETTLDFIGDGVPVSGKLQQFSMKLLEDLNQRLSHPIDNDLKRPQQKSYPNIHGLYLLLRSTGITEVVAKGKQFRMVLNPEIKQSWDQLNPTEKYFTLLEAWMVRSHPQMLGEERSGIFGMGDRCFQIWPQLNNKSLTTFKDYGHQDIFSYSPGFHNLLLMEMFGLIDITHGKPAKGKGWRVKKLQPLPFGNALMNLLSHVYLAAGLTWRSSVDPTMPFGELQPVLQSYFPEWQQNLATVSYEFRPGRHTFKVSLGKIWRRIAISGDATLEDFGIFITNSVDFDRDHLDQFTYPLPNGRQVQATHPWSEGDLSTDEVKIGELPLHEGSTMEYLFDFGDCWRFEVTLESIEPEVEPEPEPAQGFQKVKQTKKRKSSKQKTLGEILEVHGEAPEQYPSYDEDW